MILPRSHEQSQDELACMKGEIMATTSKQLLTVAQVADRLGLKEATIRRRILERRLPYVKLGRAVRIPIEVIDALIASSYRPAIEG
jgi:excisionase family DNA binding protein